MTDPHIPAAPGGPPASSAPSEREPETAGDGGPADGVHLTTLTHEGRFWDVFAEVEPPAAGSGSHRARLCFVPSGGAEGRRPARTAAIIIEPSADAALDQARSLARHEIVAMLRSAT